MAAATTMNGELNMSYDTKVILIALANLCRRVDNVKEVFDVIEEMANAEGVVLKPFNKAKKATKPQRWQNNKPQAGCSVTLCVQ